MEIYGSMKRLGDIGSGDKQALRKRAKKNPIINGVGVSGKI